MTRNEVFDAWKAAGVRTVGFEWNGDAAVEAAWAEWGRRRQPSWAVITVEIDPQRGDFRVTVEEHTAIDLE